MNSEILAQVKLLKSAGKSNEEIIKDMKKKYGVTKGVMFDHILNIVLANWKDVDHEQEVKQDSGVLQESEAAV
jgi:hypothetical protein